ncbi:MAG: hypothetical protein M3460_16820 [Actinomycetota bacterium]|nr:hypothetical protein [Actinomycetota bacterium]
MGCGPADVGEDSGDEAVGDDSPHVERVNRDGTQTDACGDGEQQGGGHADEDPPEPASVLPDPHPAGGIRCAH